MQQLISVGTTPDDGTGDNLRAGGIKINANFTELYTVTATLVASAFTDTTNAANISAGTLPAARLPAPALAALGGVKANAGVAHQWVAAINTDGTVTLVQPSAADVAGLAASAVIDATNAANISAGTLPAARLPAPALAALGGVKANAGATHQWVASINTDGTVTLTQPTFGDIAGAVAAAQMPALTGDVTTAAGAVATLIAAGVVTNAKLATMAAYTLKANATGSTAAPADIAIGGLPNKSAPASTDLLLIQDQAASGAWKNSTIAQILGSVSAGVTTFNGRSGTVLPLEADYDAYFVRYDAAQSLTAAQKDQVRTDLGIVAMNVSCGRLTLASATPVMSASVSGASTVYFTPYKGNGVLIYDGTRLNWYAFAELSQLLTDTTKSPAAASANSNYDMFVWSDAGALRCTRGPAWTSGTARGTGVGTSELQLVLGVQTNKNAITNGPGANLGTYVGTIRTNGSSLVDWIFPAFSVGATAGVFNVWNMYNRRSVSGFVADQTTGPYTYAVAAFRQLGGNANMKISFVCGLAEDQVAAQATATVSGSPANMAIGVGLDSTSAIVGSSGYTNSSITATPCVGSYSGLMQLGAHTLYPLEYAFVSTSVYRYLTTGGTTYVADGLAVQLGGM